MDTKKITWIGLGHMGVPMAKNLLKGGFKIGVYNRTAEKMKSLVDLGATPYTAINDVVMNSDIMFTMLSDDAAVSSVYADLMASDISNKVFINMSTISPELAEQLTLQIEAKGGQYLDAPVSGSVQPAIDGTLVILASGNKDTFNSAEKYFSKLGKLSLYLGKAGLGTKAKLAINYYMSVVIEGLAETVLFAEKNGIDRAMMMSIVNESACGSGMSKIKTPSIIQDNYPSAFPLKYMNKDIHLALKEGLNTALANAMGEMYDEAMNDSLGNDDLMAVIKAVKRKYF